MAEISPQSSSADSELDVAVSAVAPVVSAVVVALMTYGVLLGDGHTIFAFAGKEQFFEPMSAWLFLLSCLLALACWVRSRRQGGAVPPLRRASYALLALFFFAAAPVAPPPSSFSKP